jgi:hypothetical protein
MKITQAAVKRIAEEKGISITLLLFQTLNGNLYLEMADFPPDVIKRNLESGMYRRNTVEVERLIRKYNRQIRRITAALRANGVRLLGRQRGDGAWEYTTRAQNYTDFLVANNID